MTKTKQRLQFVKDLEPHKPDQTIALYKLDGKYVVLSTVNLDAGRVGLDPVSEAIVSLSGAICGTAMSGEETLAFPADSDGEVTNWAEIDAAYGDESRDALIAKLSA